MKGRLETGHIVMVEHERTHRKRFHVYFNGAEYANMPDDVFDEYMRIGRIAWLVMVLIQIGITGFKAALLVLIAGLIAPDLWIPGAALAVFILVLYGLFLWLLLDSKHIIIDGYIANRR